MSNKFITEILKILEIPNSEIKIIKGDLELGQASPFNPHKFSISPTSVKVEPVSYTHLTLPTICSV